MNAIELAHVTKIYHRYSGRHFATLKSALLQRSILRDLRPDETFPALSDVSFSVPKGSTYGVIGRNGSGKSTALKLVAGITKPTTGTVNVTGRISALIELGAGFHPEISGRENVFINGIMLGLTRREVQRRFDEIVEFAELQDFINAPVKTYSSGMYMRLGFAVAIHVDPEVLLVDEVLAVGDEAFTHKCLDKFAEFRRKGRTILLVTHSLSLVERFCDNALWLDRGHARAHGDPRRVVDAYLTAVEHSDEQQLANITARAVAAEAGPPAPHATGHRVETPADMFQAVEGRWGSREVEIVEVAMLDGNGRPAFVFHSGEPMSVRIRARAHTPTDDFVFGVSLFNTDGVCCYGTNTFLEDMEPRHLAGDVEVTFTVERLDLVEGTYKLDVAVHKRDGYPYDYHRLLYTFRVSTRARDIGIYRPRHHWSFEGQILFRNTEAAKDTEEAAAGRANPIAILDAGNAAAYANRLRASGLRIVFTNGVFDLLHPGHVRYLQAARDLGDRLVVAVNSDRSVRVNKGPARPITPESERAEILASLACVDAVVIFDDETPLAVIKAIQPDVLVKGADWAEDAIVGRDVVEERGGRVVRVPVESGYSTTRLVEEIRREGPGLEPGAEDSGLRPRQLEP